MLKGKIPAAVIGVAVCLLMGCASASFAGEINGKKFMCEFAGFVRGRLADEANIRRKLSVIVQKHKDELKDGLGIHPELFPEMFEAAGVDRMNCIMGRHYEALARELDEKDKHAFYDASEKLDRWVLMLAEEEAYRQKVMPMPGFRDIGNIPSYISGEIIKEMQPYPAQKCEAGGKGFTELSAECN